MKYSVDVLSYGYIRSGVYIYKGKETKGQTNQRLTFINILQQNSFIYLQTFPLSYFVVVYYIRRDSYIITIKYFSHHHTCQTFSFFSFLFFTKLCFFSDVCVSLHIVPLSVGVYPQLEILTR
jgi:hypothetical protein